MEKKLRWRVVGVKDKIVALLESLRVEIDEVPPTNTKTITKMNKWIDDLVKIRNGINNVFSSLLQDLGEKFGDKLEPDLLLAALFQPSVKNLFIELKTHYSEVKNPPVSDDHLSDLVELCEVGKTLALVGDSALDLAVLPYIWEPEMARVGSLTKKRSEYVSNDHLASVCDRWGLYDARIHFDPTTPTKKEINHIKGTLVESIFGILFLYGGLEAVNKAVPLLR
ncbi:MAG: ribonuclease III domain-containing protein [Candidatus Thorarchaeota archaeon]